LAVTLAVRAHEAAHGALTTALTLAIVLSPRLGAMWPLPSVVTLVVYGAAVRLVPGLRATARFAVRGHRDRTTTILALAFVVLAATALVIWRFASGVDMTVYRALLPAHVPTWLVFVLIVPFAMLNAIYEEVIWRGALWEASRTAFGPTATLVLTSVSFGIAHYHGFPSGFIGMALATIYGFMMGTLRQRTGGLLWPWAAHVLADVVIFMLVAAMIV